MEVSISGLEIREKKEYIQNKIQGNLNWVKTLTKKVDEGIITRENADAMIANAMTGREIRKEIAEDKSRRDPLTGLYNKGAFREEFENLISENAQFALLIIDIDNFKKINEELGYLAGDNVLVQTALNLSANLRQLRENDNENDFICKWGGEEFAVLLKNVSKKENLEKIAEKLRVATCERAFSVKIGNIDQDVPVTVSIGGGIYNGEDKNVFFDKVDKIAVKQAKNTGKNKTVII
jgi:diguanylate cyclase (GGDEF)-like protein